MFRVSPAELARRCRTLSPECKKLVRDRQTWLINEITPISIRALPREIRRRWKGSVAVDSSPFATFARHPRRVGPDNDRHVITHSADPDAGWYTRHGTHADAPHDDGTPPDRVLYGYEHTLVFMVPGGPDEDGMFPKLVLGMPAPHVPGSDPGGHATEALAQIAALNDTPGYLTGDNAYTQSKPEKFAFPARALGYDLVLDYRIDQLGRQGSHDGALLVDGRWYCPAMPTDLVEATRHYREDMIDEKTWQRRLRDRRSYEMRSKAKPGPDGSVRVLCPAAGGAPTLRCDNKPRTGRPRKPLRRVDLNDLLHTNPPTVCRQQSITIPAEAMERYYQPLRHGLEEWRRVYQPGRSTNEGGNGTVKDPSFEDIAEPGRRRLLGQAAHALICAMLHMATNLRLIRSYATHARPDESGAIRRRSRKRNGKPKRMLFSAPAPASGDPPSG